MAAARRRQVSWTKESKFLGKAAGFRSSPPSSPGFPSLTGASLGGGSNFEGVRGGVSGGLPYRMCTYALDSEEEGRGFEYWTYLQKIIQGEKTLTQRELIITLTKNH